MYNDLIVEHFTSPSYVGDIDTPDLEYELGNSVCGDRIRIHVKTTDGFITDIAFRAWGCATSVATADIFCNSVKGQSLEDINKRESQNIASMLGELEPSQYHCLDILKELHSSLLSEIMEGEFDG